MNQRSAQSPLPFCAVALVGAIFSFFTIRLHVLVENHWNTAPSFCNINSAINCDAVAASAYATMLSIPLGVWGLLFFGALFVLRVVRADSEIVDGAIVLLTGLGVLGSIVLFGVSEFLVGSLCFYCLGVYLCCFALFALSLKAPHAQTFAARLVLGLQAPATIITRGLLSPPAIAAIALWSALCLAMPQLLTIVLKPAAPTVSEKQLQEKQWMEAWQRAPVQDLPIVAEGPLQDYVMGPSFSPVKIVEFSDYECSACRYFYRTFEPLLKKHAGKFSFIIKNFPLDPSCNPIMRGAGGHPNACAAAVASLCAGEQGKFFEGAERLFLLPALEHPTPPGLDPLTEIHRLDTALNIDPTAFSQCLSSGRADQKILADIKLGMELNVESTPTIFINGRKIPSFNFELIEKIINSGGTLP